MMPLTASTPKPLLQAAGRSLIEWQILRLRQAGVEQVVINLNYLGEQIEAALGDGSHLGVQLTYSREEDLLETAGGIIQALPLLGDCFLLANADVWTDYPFQRLLPGDGCASGDEPLAHLVLVANAPHHPQGDFYLLESGKVVDHWPGSPSDTRHSTLDETAAPPRLTYAGIARLRSELFAGLPAGPRLLAPLLRAAMREGRVTGELYAGEWRDIGTPQRLADLQRLPPVGDAL